MSNKWVKKITADVYEKVDKKTDENVRGVLEDSHNMLITKKWIEGSLNKIISELLQ